MIYSHPLIAPTFREGERLMRKIPVLERLPQAKGNRPSYIAPRNFALALLDVVAEGSECRAAGLLLTTFAISLGAPCLNLAGFLKPT